MVLFYIIIGIAVLLLIIAFTIPSTYVVETKIPILTKPEDAFNKIAYLHNFSKWFPFAIMEKNTVFNFKTIPIVVSNNNQTKVTVERTIGFDMVVSNSFEISSNHLLSFTESQNETEVVWKIAGELTYPIGRLMSKSVNSKLKTDMEIGLIRLKELCEN